MPFICFKARVFEQYWCLLLASRLLLGIFPCKVWFRTLEGWFLAFQSILLLFRVPVWSLFPLLFTTSISAQLFCACLKTFLIFLDEVWVLKLPILFFQVKDLQVISKQVDVFHPNADLQCLWVFQTLILSDVLQFL